MRDELHRMLKPPIVAIIPARGGSKGLPRKNIRDIGGRPLIAWSIEDALESKRIGRVYVSSEDAEIIQVARQAGAETINRPVELSQDTTSSEAVLLHALDYIAAERGGDPELVVFLQATCPIRKGADIDHALAILEESGADSLLSVSPTHIFLWGERDGAAIPLNYDWKHRPRRQDMDPQYRENGSIYVFKPWVLREGENRLGGRIVLYKMSEAAGIDIDSEIDMELAGLILRRNMGGLA